MFESEEKSSHKLPLLVPKSKENSTSQAIDEDNDEEGRKEESKEEPASELPQGPIDPRVQKLINGLAFASFKEFMDNRKSNYMLHMDNVRIKVRLEAST